MGWLCDPTLENSIWRRKLNVELNNIMKGENIIKFVKAQRIGLIGHIERLDNLRPFKGCTSRPSERTRMM